MNWNFFKKKK
jgi:HK97 family phage portal protein